MITQERRPAEPGRPPGPRDWLLGLPQLQQLRRDLLGYYMHLAGPYGDTVYLRLGPYRNYLFFHPDQIREVLVTKARQFIKLPRARKILARLDGDGLVFSEGDFWLRQRRLVQPAFHARRLEEYGRPMVDLTRSLIKRWKVEFGEQPVIGKDWFRCPPR